MSLHDMALCRQMKKMKLITDNYLHFYFVLKLLLSSICIILSMIGTKEKTKIESFTMLIFMTINTQSLEDD